MKRRAGLAEVLIICLVLSGCWDRQEIESRGFVLAVAVDLATPEEVLDAQTLAQVSEPNSIEYAPTINQTRQFRMTIQYPILKRARAPGPSGGGGGSPEEAAFWNLTGVGSSLFGINHDFAARTSIPPFYEHLQAIVISEEAARAGLNLFMDFFFRDPELRRRTPVFITPQSAHSILEVRPELEDFTAMYISRILRNVKRTSRIAHKSDLGGVSKALHNNLDFLLPRVVTSGREIKESGGAVFKKDKLVGWLNEDEMQAAKWLSGYAVGDWIEVPCPDHPPGPIVLDINDGDTKLRVLTNGSKPVVEFSIEMSGNIAEDLCMKSDHVFDSSFLRRVEAQVAKTMEEKMDRVLKRIQQELQSDLLRMGVEIERQNPKLWSTIKGRWDEIYPTVETKVKVSVVIKLVNLARRSP